MSDRDFWKELPFLTVRGLAPLAVGLALLVNTTTVNAFLADVTIGWESVNDGRVVLALRGVKTDPAKYLEVTYQIGNAPPRALPGTARFDPKKHVLIFDPTFPLDPGVTYRACYRSDGLELKIERRIESNRPEPEIKAVYPSSDLLPENQLKFYLHFSAPMARGEVYQKVRILDSKGKPIILPFLEIGEELWDPTGTRLTLLLDPGRIKRGLKPREEDGPILEEGKSYTFVIEPGLVDVEGKSVKVAYRKAFRVGPPDDTQPKVANWKVSSPVSSTRQPLSIRFPEPLDHAFLQHAIVVVDPSGKTVAGVTSVRESETLWIFTPTNPWHPGTHVLQVDPDLEDLAGNSIRRPFEIDILRPIPQNAESNQADLAPALLKVLIK